MCMADNFLLGVTPAVELIDLLLVNKLAPMLSLKANNLVDTVIPLALAQETPDLTS